MYLVGDRSIDRKIKTKGNSKNCQKYKVRLYLVYNISYWFKLLTTGIIAYKRLSDGF